MKDTREKKSRGLLSKFLIVKLKTVIYYLWSKEENKFYANNSNSSNPASRAVVQTFWLRFSADFEFTICFFCQTQPKPNGYLARSCKILAKPCKTMHRLARFSGKILQDNHSLCKNLVREAFVLQESCKITICLVQILQDSYLACKNLAK